MPRVNKNKFQKNKPFKGSKSNKSSVKMASSKNKPISKAVASRRVSKKKHSSKKEQISESVRLKTAKNEYLDSATKTILTEGMKSMSRSKTILLIACNKDANTGELLEQFY